jgi:hypothetical protein
LRTIDEESVVEDSDASGDETDWTFATCGDGERGIDIGDVTDAAICATERSSIVGARNCSVTVSVDGDVLCDDLDSIVEVDSVRFGARTAT